MKLKHMWKHPGVALETLAFILGCIGLLIWCTILDGWYWILDHTIYRNKYKGKP